MPAAIWFTVVALAIAPGALAQENGRKEAPVQDTRASAGEPLHLKVDVVAPRGEDRRDPLEGTHKPGWWPWVIPDWDFYRTDLVWEDGSQSYPANGPGISGSGVHVAVTCHYEGILTLHVAGMRRYLAGGISPEKKPIYDPIANTWLAGSDFPDNPASDLLLCVYGLGPGTYRLKSYHNSFNGRRFGDEPTGVEYTEARTPEPPMPAITVYPLKEIQSRYFEKPAESLPKGKRFGTSLDKLLIEPLLGEGMVHQTLMAKDVKIQQDHQDENLIPSVIEFRTDGSPLAVVYSGGSGKGDDLRPHRKGGYAVLNAFELIQVSP